jgi:hypothetical protein
MADCSLDDLAAAAAIALQEGVVAGFDLDEGEDMNASDSASSA